jgi:uncharacterized protein YbjQ (UPF0145 family)
MSEPRICSICQKPKAPKTCDLCEVAICKSCQETLSTDAFLYLAKIPPKLAHSSYCINCYEEEVLPALNEYNVMTEKAKDVYYLSKAYPGYIRVLQRHTKRVVVEDCDDRRETIIRLAFQAAEMGFNAIIEAEVESFKTRHHAHKSARWKGSAMPAKIDGDHLELTSLRRI